MALVFTKKKQVQSPVRKWNNRKKNTNKKKKKKEFAVTIERLRLHNADSTRIVSAL